MQNPKSSVPYAPTYPYILCTVFPRTHFAQICTSPKARKPLIFLRFWHIIHQITATFFFLNSVYTKTPHVDSTIPAPIIIHRFLLFSCIFTIYSVQYEILSVYAENCHGDLPFQSIAILVYDVCLVDSSPDHLLHLRTQHPIKLQHLLFILLCLHGLFFSFFLV